MTTPNISLQTPNSTAPQQWLEAQRQIWQQKKTRMEREMMQLIEDHSSCMTNLAAVDRLLSIYETSPNPAEEGQKS